MAESKLMQIRGMFNLIADANDKLEMASRYAQENPEVLGEEDSRALEGAAAEVYGLFERFTHLYNDVDPLDFHKREKSLRDKGIVAMNEKIISKLISLADRLDEKGLHKEAKDIDVVIKKAFLDMNLAGEAQILSQYMSTIEDLVYKGMKAMKAGDAAAAQKIAGTLGKIYSGFNQTVRGFDQNIVNYINKLNSVGVKR